MTTPPFLGHAPPVSSTVQHSWGLTYEGDRHLEQRHYTTAPGCGSATVDALELQCLESWIRDGYSVSISELPTCPVISAPLLARNSSLVGYLSGEPGSAQLASSSGYVTGENRASSIINDSPSVDHACGYWVMQDHASDCITNHDTALPLSFTSLLPPYTIEQSSGYPQESGDASTFGYLENNFTGPMAGLGSIPSLRDCTSGQVIGSDAPRSWISNPLLPSLQEPQPSKYFTCGNVPLPPEQTRTGLVVLPQSLSSFTTQLTEHSTSSSPSFPMPNQNSSSCSPEEYLSYPFPFNPHYVRPVGLPGFHGFNPGSKMELHTSDTLDNHAAQALGDHPSHTLSDHETHLFPSHATHIPDDYTADGGVDDYGNFDESKLNSEQVVGLHPQLLPPPNQLPLSPHRLYLRDRASRIKGRGLSGTSYPGRSCVTTRPKVRSVCGRNTSYSCGWRDDKGRKCGMPISYGDCTGHFAAAHGIRNIARNVKVVCCWCPSEPAKGGRTQKLLEACERGPFVLSTLGEWDLGTWDFV
ncbi:hypothetical protein F5141DRAFT_1288819 [Pisolithus sp. B1]|nr:hypothetical protein F5141DRAFT_1288819 [Pisolithus sp. B1]